MGSCAWCPDGMRTSLLALIVALPACKTDQPARSENTVAMAPSATAPRRAKLPALTRTNALVVHVQLRAEMAWNDATSANTSDAWDLAADLFQRALASCRADCRELAYSEVLARKNAVMTDPSLRPPAEKPTSPVPLPARIEAMVDAADQYIAASPPDDPDALGAAFIAGQQYNNYGWIDESTTRFANVILTKPTEDVALYSANLMLDAFNRSERWDEMLQWARDLQANTVLMATHPELAELVADLLARAARAGRQ